MVRFAIRTVDFDRLSTLSTVSGREPVRKVREKFTRAHLQLGSISSLSPFRSGRAALCGRV